MYTSATYLFNGILARKMPEQHKVVKMSLVPGM